METKTIVQYVVAGVVVAGSLFVAYNAQDKITDQASEIKVLQNQVAALNDKATENEELVTKNKALEAEVKNLEAKLGAKTKEAASQKQSKLVAKSKAAKKAQKPSKKK
jgi:regulator of replication initiation timing